MSAVPCVLTCAEGEEERRGRCRGGYSLEPAELAGDAWAWRLAAASRANAALPLLPPAALLPPFALVLPPTLALPFALPPLPTRARLLPSAAERDDGRTSGLRGAWPKYVAFQRFSSSSCAAASAAAAVSASFATWPFSTGATSAGCIPRSAVADASDRSGCAVCVVAGVALPPAPVGNEPDVTATEAAVAGAMATGWNTAAAAAPSRGSNAAGWAASHNCASHSLRPEAESITRSCCATTPGAVCPCCSWATCVRSRSRTRHQRSWSRAQSTASSTVLCTCSLLLMRVRPEAI